MIVKYTNYNSDWDGFNDHFFEIPDAVNPKKEYYNLLAEEAKKLGAVFNPHWYNLMNHKNHHPHLTEEEYADLEVAWEKVLEVNSIFNFLSKVGERVEYVDWLQLAGWNQE